MQTMNVQKPDLHPGQWGMWASLDANALNSRLLTLARAIREITDTADAARRDLTQEENGRLQDLIFQSESVEALLARMDGEDEYAPRRGTGRRTTAQGPDGTDYRTDAPRARRETPLSGFVVGKTKEGETIRGFRPKEALPPVAGPAPDYDFQTWIRAMYSGDHSHIRAETTQTEGVGADGGMLVIPQFSRDIIDLVRNKTQVIQAGAITIPMSTNSLTFARQTGDPTAYWRGELDPITPSKATFEPVNFRAHSLAAIVTMSEELLMDSPNAGAILQNSLAQALALKLDASFLSGDGVGKPLGVLNTSGVQTTAAVGVLSTIGKRYTVVSEAWGLLLAANFQPSGLLYNGKTAAKFDALIDAEDRPLLPPNSWNSFAKLVTNQLEETSTTSPAILGDWSNLWLAMRQEIRIDFDRSGTVGGINAFEALGVHVRAWLRADAMVVHPLAFCLIPGITTTP